MQKYKVSFKGQNIYVGIDVHLKTWHVTTLTETGCKYSFAQHADAKELKSDSLKHVFCYLSLQIIYKYAKSLTALAAPSLVVVVPDEQETQVTGICFAF